MTLRRLRTLTGLALLLSCAVPAWPQQTAPPDPAEQDTDLPDVIRAWRNRPPREDAQPDERTILIAPIIGTNPSAGFFVGVAGQITRFRGDPSTTRITSGIASLTLSTRKQVIFNGRFDSFSEGNVWLIEGDNRLQATSQNIYGLGGDTPSSAAIGTDFGFVRIYETLSRRLAKDVYVGGGVLFDSHSSVEPHDPSDPNWQTGPYITYSEQNGLPINSQQSTGFSVNVQVNRRDNDISARRGWILSGQYRWSIEGLLGGDSSWQQVTFDARAYVPFDPRGRHRLAVWGYSSIVTTGVAPYFDLPATVMDTYGRSARAYRDGRYRGDQLVYGEAEYRGPLMENGLLGMVAFATMTTVADNDSGEKVFDSVAPSAGGGLRLLLNKRSRTNLCFDLAWGRGGARGVYIAIQDAF